MKTLLATKGVAPLFLTQLIVVVFSLADAAAAYDNKVDLEASSHRGDCPLSRIELDLGNLMSSVNVTLKGLESLFGPLTEGEGVYVASLDGSTAQNHLVSLLVKKMEAENEQLRARISDLEVEKSRISSRVTEWNEEYSSRGDQKQMSEVPCYSLQWPRDCQDLFHQGKNVSGIYTIYPQKCGFVGKSVRVWCDMEGEDGGWTTILLRRKREQQVDFNKGWRYYRLGFGDPETEYWIGGGFVRSLSLRYLLKRTYRGLCSTDEFKGELPEVCPSNTFKRELRPPNIFKKELAEVSVPLVRLKEDLKRFLPS